MSLYIETDPAGHCFLSIILFFLHKSGQNVLLSMKKWQILPKNGSVKFDPYMTFDRTRVNYFVKSETAVHVTKFKDNK